MTEESNQENLPKPETNFNTALVSVCVTCTVDSALLSDACLGVREEDLSALS